MAKRIFIALPLSEYLKQLVVQWQQDHTYLPVRWISPKNLHITLLPPWPENDVDKVIDKLNSASIRMPAFPIIFEHISFGPNPKMPRLIWASGPTPPELNKLKQQIEATLDLPADSRLLKLHFTLARFKTENYHKFRNKYLNEIIAWQDRVNSFALLQSHLTSEGSEYEAIEQFLL